MIIILKDVIKSRQTEAKTKKSKNFSSNNRKHINKITEIWTSLLYDMDKSLSVPAVHRLQKPSCNFTKTRVPLQVFSLYCKFFKNSLFVEFSRWQFLDFLGQPFLNTYICIPEFFPYCFLFLLTSVFLPVSSYHVTYAF